MWPYESMSRFIDRTGQTFGELTVLRKSCQNKRHQWFWMCACSCGTECEIFSGNLHSGHTISCGCKKGLHSHGDAVGKGSAEYHVLHGMIGRCTNKKHPSYYLYGERGVRVCERWNHLSKFPQFLQDVGRRPSDLHSIDRFPDKDGNYEPGNVRWATYAEQNRNTRRNVFLTFRGQTLCRKDMAEKYGINQMVLKKRLSNGWDLESALTTPINSKMRNKKYKCLS